MKTYDLNASKSLELELNQIAFSVKSKIFSELRKPEVKDQQSLERIVSDGLKTFNKLADELYSAKFSENDNDGELLKDKNVIVELVTITYQSQPYLSIFKRAMNDKPPSSSIGLLKV